MKREHYTVTERGWTYDDQIAALEEGWGLFDTEEYGVRIEREGERFDGDNAAIAFVGHRAALGNPLARKAFAELAWVYAVQDAAEEGR